MKSKKIKWNFNIGDRIDDLEIVNRRMGRIQEYQYKCLKCGFDGRNGYYKNGEFFNEHWITGNSLNAGSRCGCCSGNIVQTGVNDIKTTCPEVVARFADKTIIERYSKGSCVKTLRICPSCGEIYPIPCTIYSIINEGRRCINCDDGFTFPERFMYFMLLQLNIKFKIHMLFPWAAKSTDNKNGYKYYDFYLPDHNVIIEMHGVQHYDPDCSFYKFGKMTFEQQQDNDIKKQKMAEDRGYEYIIIDCRRDDLSWLSNQIASSKLSEIINLSAVDWQKCNFSAIKGVTKLIIEEKKEYPDRTASYLAQKYGISHVTVQRWLKKNAELCNYNPNDEQSKGNSMPIYCPELNEAFLNAKSVFDKYGIHRSSIYDCINGKRRYKSAGKHPITCEPLHWQRISLNQYEEWRKNQQYKIN